MIYPLRIKHIGSLIVLCLLSTVLTGGCTTGQYRAHKLPKELQAKSYTNSKTVDLTRFTAMGVNAQTIAPGDVVEVSIAASLNKDDLVTIPVRIDDEGQAQLPLLGPMRLKGMELSEAEAVITSACIQSELYRTPHVTVTFTKQKQHRVLVVGGVKNPGAYLLNANSSDMLSAISMAGGFDDKAGTVVEIRNPNHGGHVPDAPAIAGSDPQNGNRLVSHEQSQGQTTPVAQSSKSIRVDLASMTNSDPKELSLQDGAVVSVERRDPKPIHVLGLVKHPDRYEFPVAEDLKLLDAIALAQGVSNPLADKIFVIRNPPQGGKPVLIQASIQKAMAEPDENIRLSPGDVVSVEKTPGTVIMDTFNIVKFSLGGALF
jgi:polysaccharide export outer membrane protein